MTSAGNIGLGTSLRSLVNSLAVNQEVLGYISENVSNASTVGYTRKIVSQQSNVSNGVVLGVSIAEIRRSIDDFLNIAAQEQLSKTSLSEVKNTYQSRIQEFVLGNPNSGLTINNSLNEFYSRLEVFANDPSSAIKRSSVIDGANDFTNALNEIARGIQSERYNSDVEISSTITTLNNTLNNLFDINKSIKDNALASNNLGRLLDARDVELNKIKEIIDADFSYDAVGSVSVNLNNIELLGPGQKYVLEYNRVSSIDSLVNNVNINAITVIALNADGSRSNSVQTVFPASSDTISQSVVTDGKLKGLLEIRDQDLPSILAQLDTFTSTFAEAFNEIHNSGTGFPPPRQIVGESQFGLNDEFYFSGKVQIALTDSNGAPIQGRFGEPLLPLTINFDEFDGGNGVGSASVESIINEINSYYGLQPAKIANVGAANDIKIAAKTNNVESVKATGTIVLSALPTAGETIDINGVSFEFVASGATGNQINIGTNIPATLENIADTLNASSNVLVSVAEYDVTNSSTITITHNDFGAAGNSFSLATSGANITLSGATLANGEDANGTFSFDIELTNLHNSAQDITLDITSYTIGSTTNSSPTFSEITFAAGERKRTDINGQVNDLISGSIPSGLVPGDSFTVSIDVRITDEDGNISNETLTYTIDVPEPDTNIINKRYSVTSVGSGDGEIVAGDSTGRFLTAALISNSGSLISNNDSKGFLKLSSSNDNVRIVVNQSTSKEIGTYGSPNPIESATNRGFSHFFGLNNFFEYNNTATNSALNLQVREDINKLPSLLASGNIVRSQKTGVNETYTYEVGSGSNTVALELVKLQDSNLTFGESGGLPELRTTINAYGTEIYSFASLLASSASSNFEKDTLLNSSLQSKFSSISGVNIDEELALTIQVQNAYAAAAKVISIVKDLFQELRDAI